MYFHIIFDFFVMAFNMGGKHEDRTPGMGQKPVTRELNHCHATMF